MVYIFTFWKGITPLTLYLFSECVWYPPTEWNCKSEAKKKNKNLAYMIFSIQICRLVLTFGNQCRLVQTVNRGKNLGKRCISAWNSVQQNLTECWGLESYLKPELFLTWHAVSKMQRSKAKYVCLNVCGCSDGALKEMDLKPKTLLLKTIKKEKDKLVTSHT